MRRETFALVLLAVLFFSGIEVTYRLPGNISSTVAMGYDGRLYFAVGKDLYALDVSSAGSFESRSEKFSCDGKVVAGPVASGEGVYVADEYGYLYLLWYDMSLRWKVKFARMRRVGREVSIAVWSEEDEKKREDTVAVVTTCGIHFVRDGRLVSSFKPKRREFLHVSRGVFLSADDFWVGVNSQLLHLSPSGVEKERFPLKYGERIVGISTDGDRLFFGTSSGRVYVHNTHAFELEVRLTLKPVKSEVLTDSAGNLYYYAGNTLASVDGKNGAQRFVVRVGGDVLDAFVGSDCLYVLTTGSAVDVYSLSGKFLKRLALPAQGLRGMVPTPKGLAVPLLDSAILLIADERVRLPVAPCWYAAGGGFYRGERLPASLNNFGYDRRKNYSADW